MSSLAILASTAYPCGSAAAGTSPEGLPHEARIDLVVQQYEVAAALAGNGAVMAQPAFFRRELHQGVLIQLFDVMLCDGQDYCLTYPARRRNSRKIRLFRDWLLDEARNG